jgi:uncharacterized membrane protein
MKKIISICIIFSITLLACHKKAVPVVGTRTEQPEAPASAHPVYAAADLEAGKIVYETKCIKCHAAKPVANYTAARWTGILKSMVPKAKLDSTQTAQVTAYVNTNAKKS